MRNHFRWIACVIFLIATNDYCQLPSARVPDGLGVNIHFTDPQPGEMEMLAGAGFKWIRMDLSWPAIEKKRGEYDFAPWDRLLTTCDKFGIRAILIFDYSNPLYDGNQSPHSEEGVKAFATWAAAAVKHFRGRHVLWEIYNEPNGFWRPHPEVKPYVKLALATVQAVKSVDPKELCMGPALSGTNGAWLEPCYQAGLLKWWDAVSVHPYGNEAPETRLKHYQGVRALIARYEPAGKHTPLISGEWGYTAAQYPGEAQGKLLARQFLFNLSQGIPLSIWYDWRDDGDDPKNAEHNFGLVSNAYHANQSPPFQAKSTYRAAYTLMHQLDGFSFERELKMDSPSDFAVVFKKGEEERVVVWTSESNHKVKLPLSGTWSGTDYRGRRVGEVSGSVELSDGPTYLRRMN